MNATTQLTDKVKRRKTRKAKLKKNERVMPTPRLARMHERRYGSAIKNAIREQKRIVMRLYKNGTIKQVSQNIAPIFVATAAAKAWLDAQKAAKHMVRVVNGNHSMAFSAATKNTIGIDLKSLIKNEGLTDIMKTTINENVQMIKDLDESTQRRITRTINRAFVEQTGKTEDLRQELLKAFDIGYNKATQISRDQTQRFFNSLNRYRQQSVGIKKYMWITSKDNRVRDTHKANARKVFYWSSPPVTTGHPGHDYNCRCTASAVIEINENDS